MAEGFRRRGDYEVRLFFWMLILQVFDPVSHLGISTSRRRPKSINITRSFTTRQTRYVLGQAVGNVI